MKKVTLVLDEEDMRLIMEHLFFAEEETNEEIIELQKRGDDDENIPTLENRRNSALRLRRTIAMKTQLKPSRVLSSNPDAYYSLEMLGE